MIQFPEFDALTLTIRQWSWLLCNPGFEKKDCPEWDMATRPEMIYKGERIFGNCFLCHHYRNCLGCPLLGANTRCETYWEWKTSDKEGRKAMAARIIEKCEDRLKEISHAKIN